MSSSSSHRTKSKGSSAHSSRNSRRKQPSGAFQPSSQRHGSRNSSRQKRDDNVLVRISSGLKTSYLKDYSHKAEDENTVIVQGWLVKQGGFKGGMKTWKRRWFVLKNDSLSYYKSADDGSDYSKDLGLHILGVLHIKGAQVVEVVESSKEWFSKAFSSGKTNLFAIQTPYRTLWIKADSDQDKDIWISKIMDAIKSCEYSEPSNDDNGDRLRSGTTPVNEWELDSSDMILGEKIAKGMFGEVYHGRIWGTPVAIKKIYLDESKISEILKDLENEIEILSKLRHPNIVLYIGACTSYPDIRIVTEWCDRGCLSDLLYDSKKVLNMRLLLNVAIDIAQGMNYLHSIDTGIIHRDLKSENILIDRNLLAKVADFGLSYKSASTDRSAGIFGTPKWMAPEVMLGKRYDESVDIWSYGVVLCELFSREKPYSDRYDIETYDDVVSAVIDDNASPKIPEWCGPKIRALITKCFSREPNKRPTFASILSELGTISSQSSQSLFNQFDVPRIQEYLWSKNFKNQERACREISDNIFQHQDNDASDCFRCGYSSSDEGSVSSLNDKTMSMLILGIISCFSQKNVALLYQALRAFRAILSISNAEQCSIYREMVHEEGCIRRLLIFLNSRNTSVRIEASRLISAMTTHLSSAEQANFVDLTYSGLNALSALSGGYLGLEKLAKEIHAEVDGLEKMKTDLEEKIRQKNVLSQRIDESCSILHVRWQKEKLGVSDMRKSLRFSRAEITVRTTTAGILDPLDEEREFHSNDLQGDDHAHLEDILSRADSEEWPENHEISDQLEISTEFKEYFGDGNRTIFSNALFWDQDSQYWKHCFIFLFGDEVRIYEDCNSDPEDPISLIYIDENSLKSISMLVNFQERSCVLKLESNYIDTIHFAFVSHRVVMEWAHIIDPIKFERPVSVSSSMGKRISISSRDELSSIITDYGSKEEMIKLIKTAEELEHVSQLPEAYADYYDGLDIIAYGYILMNAVGNSEEEWVSVFCILVNGELRIFSNIQDDPDDCQLVVYTSGPFRSSNYVLVLSDSSNSQDLLIANRCFLIRDDTSLYKICTRDSQDFTKWTRALCP